MRRLARAILLLTDPFHPSPDFRAILRSKEFDKIASRACEGYFDECDFHLRAQLDNEGYVTAEVRDGSGMLLHQGDARTDCGQQEAQVLPRPVSYV